ncbi:MAG: hypothetical protein M3680_36430, partial [Myxococcota bacterium]|nr:hypothetical protein [Myxococcota bacterium]
MRVALLAAVIGLVPALGLGPAGADTLKKPIVWKNRVLPPLQPDANGPVALTSVSRKLYLNDCKPNGCAVFPGADNSLTNRSSIAESNVVLSAYHHGDEHWGKLVQCVKDTFAPFDVEILTTDPGSSVSHFEVMIGGSDSQLHPELQAGGVAPFISCNAQRNNIISFVFPQTTDDLEYLCGAVVQEAAHVWGLDHELNAADPLTYLELGSLKRFQNDDALCGEELGAARRCFCGGTTQNTFRYMINTFGLQPGLAEPLLTVNTPRNDQWVKPGFPITAQLVSPLDAISATIKIDAATVATFPKGPYAANAPATLAPGDHAITVTASDAGDRMATATINVHVMSSCAAGEKCGSGFHCLGGLCLPGSGVDGGLGAACEGNDECVTGSCGSDGSDSKCTAACDAGASCPSGYDCLGANGGAGVCWPSEGGGCST